MRITKKLLRKINRAIEDFFEHELKDILEDDFPIEYRLF